MSPKSLLAILALALLVALAGYVHFQRDGAERVLADTLSTPAVPPASKDDAGELLPSPESVATESNSEDNDPPKEYAMTLTGERVEVETVMGIRVRKDRNCTVRIHSYRTHEDGTTTPIHSCEPNEPKPVDIYTTYSNAELETLAYSDSRAAYNLAVRLRDRDYQRATDYALRSAALNGDIKGIAVMMVSIPHSARDGEKLNLKYLEEQYVLSGVAQAVDSSSTTFNRVSREVTAFDGNGINIEMLDARIANHLKTIGKIRSEVGID